MLSKWPDANLLRRSREPQAGIPLLVKALGLKRGKRTIVDATAGLGRESFLMASLGFQVIAIERVPEIFGLLSEHFNVSTQATHTNPISIESSKRSAILSRIQLIQADAKIYLPTLSPAPDIIYMDPMSDPLKIKNKAAVAKVARILRDHVPPTDDALELLQIARSVARDRVVVKRPFHEAPLANDVTQNWGSKGARFDMYLTKKNPGEPEGSPEPT